MSSPAIRVENLGKKYKLGLTHAGTVRDLVGNLARRFSRQRPPDDAAPTNGNGNGDAKEFWALKDVSFEVQPGEVLGIIGRNGAGKSTLLKILSRVTCPTTGRIELNGRVASLLEVGTGFHVELTGRENVYLNGAILGMTRPEIRRKFDEIVDFAEIARFVDTPVKRYSSGMKVRLGFAVAAHLQPEILLIDEVLAVGDLGFQRKCLGKIADITRQGRTVLFVSHNMSAVAKLCPRCMLFETGLLSRDGASVEVIASYVNVCSAGQPGVSWCVNTLRLHEHQKSADAPIVLQEVALLNDEGQTLRYLTTGDGLAIRLRYRTRRRVVSPGVMVSIRTRLGTEISRLSTTPVSGFHIEEMDGEGYVTLRLPRLDFLGGEYSLTVAFARSGIEHVSVLEDLVFLSVRPRDVYDSGIDLDNRWGLIALEHEWEHRRIRPESVTS